MYSLAMGFIWRYVHCIIVSIHRNTSKISQAPYVCICLCLCTYLCIYVKNYTTYVYIYDYISKYKSYINIHVHDDAWARLNMECCMYPRQFWPFRKIRFDRCFFFVFPYIWDKLKFLDGWWYIQLHLHSYPMKSHWSLWTLEKIMDFLHNPWSSRKSSSRFPETGVPLNHPFIV